MEYRIEEDALGTVKVPKNAYYGSETARAIENFRISDVRMQTELINSYAILKKAAALANMKLGRLDRKIGEAIVYACNEIIGGRLRDQFPIDVFQAGAGTSTNMNVNEVIANAAILKLKGRKGDYSIVSPNDHVNMSQSTNDTFHANTHLAAYKKINSELLPSLSGLKKGIEAKSREFSRIIKVGRTHLQDAVPITLGQEFSGYSGAIGICISEIEHASASLLELPLGGTAVGTGINAPKGYPEEVIRQLNSITGLKFTNTKRMFAQMQNQLEEVMVSNSLKIASMALSKISNDLRLLASGPRAGISEITLPPVQPGSSIMPGKVNPSIPEMVNMVCFEVNGRCCTIENAAMSGQLELNVFMPVIAYNIMFSIGILSNASSSLAGKCISGIRANKAAINAYLEKDVSVATALNPYIGYKKAAEIANEAYRSGKSVMEVCIEKKILDRKILERILNPKNSISD